MGFKNYFVPTLVAGMVVLSACSPQRNSSTREQISFERYETGEERNWREYLERESSRYLRDTGSADYNSSVDIACGMTSLREEIANGVYRINWDMHRDCVRRNGGKPQR